MRAERMTGNTSIKKQDGILPIAKELPELKRIQKKKCNMRDLR
jgi:hypothetical protein